MDKQWIDALFRDLDLSDWQKDALRYRINAVFYGEPIVVSDAQKKTLCAVPGTKTVY